MNFEIKFILKLSINLEKLMESIKLLSRQATDFIQTHLDKWVMLLHP